MIDSPNTVTVNGEPRDNAVGLTVTDLLIVLETPADGRGLAVAVDGEVVARSDWSERTLRAGERVEVLTAIQGG